MRNVYCINVNVPGTLLLTETDKQIFCQELDNLHKKYKFNQELKALCEKHGKSMTDPEIAKLLK